MGDKIFVKKKYLIFREDAKRIAQKIKKTDLKKISLDFSLTLFMSRSFIDELINQIGKLENEGKEIKFSSLKPSLLNFILKVKKTKNKIQKEMTI